MPDACLFPGAVTLGRLGHVKKLLGRATFANVFLTKCEHGEVAVKICLEPQDPTYHAEVDKLKKVAAAPDRALLCRLKANGLLPSVHGRECGFVMLSPACNQGTLDELIVKGVAGSEELYDAEAILRWSFQVATTLLILHAELDVVHVDVVPENVCLHRRPSASCLDAYLIDFGEPAHEHPVHSLTMGRLLSADRYGAHVSPEHATGREPYDKKLAEVWSWGVVVYALLTRSLEYSGLGGGAHKRGYLRCLSTSNSDATCLIRDIERRWSADVNVEVVKPLTDVVRQCLADPPSVRGDMGSVVTRLQTLINAISDRPYIPAKTTCDTRKASAQASGAR